MYYPLMLIDTVLHGCRRFYLSEGMTWSNIVTVSDLIHSTYKGKSMTVEYFDEL